MNAQELDAAQWARDNGRCFEVEPLVEVIQGHEAHLEFTVRLYPGQPMDDDRPRAARLAEAAEIRAKLEGILRSLARWRAIPHGGGASATGRRRKGS